MYVCYEQAKNNQFKIDFNNKTIKRGNFKWICDITFDRKYQLNDFIKCLIDNDFTIIEAE